MSAKGQTAVNKVCKIVSCLFLYLCALIAVSPLIGTIWSFLKFKWGIFPIFLIFILAFAGCYILQKFDFFFLQSGWELFIFTGMMAFILFIYIQYSPVLSIQQDQALYILKSFNLINHGTLEKPISTFCKLAEKGFIYSNDLILNNETYGMFENGTQIRDNVLHPDFYAGSAYFYAIFGMISKRYAFYGQTLIMIVNGWLLYCLLRHLLKSKDKLLAAIYTMTFAVSPVIIWFGRSSSTEPTALFFWALIFCLLLIGDMPEYILSLVFMTALIARIDYFLVVLLGCFIITYRNRKWGAIYTVSTSIFMYIVSQVFWIYYNRIGARDFKIIKLQIPLMLFMFIASYIISRWGRNLVDGIYNNVACKYILILLGGIVVVLMFRNTLTPEQYLGRFTEFGENMYSNEELILDHLYQAFPSIIIVGGLIGSYKLLRHKEMNMLAGIFVLPLLVVSCYFVYKSGNAPQMYFLLRRYYNIFLPTLLISFVVFIESENREKNILISGVIFLLACNLYMDSRQKVEYAELDTNVEAFENRYSDKDISTIFYDYDDKYDISPIVSYCAYDIVPLQNKKEIKNVCTEEANKYYEKNKSIYLTTKEMDGLDYIDIINLSYYRMDETLIDIPTEYYYKEVLVYVYDMKDVNMQYKK